MAITLEPGGESVAVAHLAQSAHIVIGNAVGNEPTQIPQETLALVLRTDDRSVERGKVGDGVVAIACAERLGHIISPVESAGLVTVLYYYLEGSAVLGRNAPQDFAQEGIEMGSHMLSAHLVHLVSSGFLAGWCIGHTRRSHSRAQYGPSSLGRFPHQRTVLLHVGSEVNDLGGLRDSHPLRLLLRAPHVLSPHGQR